MIYGQAALFVSSPAVWSMLNYAHTAFIGKEALHKTCLWLCAWRAQLRSFHSGTAAIQHEDAAHIQLYGKVVHLYIFVLSAVSGVHPLQVISAATAVLLRAVCPEVSRHKTGASLLLTPLQPLAVTSANTAGVEVQCCALLVAMEGRMAEADRPRLCKAQGSNAHR